MLDALFPAAPSSKVTFAPHARINTNANPAVKSRKDIMPLMITMHWSGSQTASGAAALVRNYCSPIAPDDGPDEGPLAFVEC